MELLNVPGVRPGDEIAGEQRKQREVQRGYGTS
jgi:hypothetical protein